MRILVTGTAGFIGFHLARRLLQDGYTVIGIDGMTDYYDVSLKRRRHALLHRFGNFTSHAFMLEDAQALHDVFAHSSPAMVVHLAGQAGVSHSLDAPGTYIGSNILGTYALLEAVRRHGPLHLMMASSSSVYGANTVLPFSEAHRCDHPLSLYAATKKAAEDIAHSYSCIWNIPTTVLRFFTAYGPWGRPDMALFRFIAGTYAGKPIDVYNNGNMARDFTYIDDVVEAIVRLSRVPPEKAGEGDPGSSPAAPYRVVNIGSNRPVSLLAFIAAIEKATGRPCARHYLPMRPGDVPRTWADCSALESLTGFRPSTPLQTGVDAFVAWYDAHYANAPQP
ncbi:NAD-dependent epimerase/dehydratase family protein [Gluconacetobacter takamatsuzukensis]|uniref:NAD-dependent epimerase/dehydratase family protein n=1 Tax=Gluconacetobacter takamatsuzukensis TaxID=1286190 RepID=A0A7W4KCX7_9PROT|nr:NAD-dependent epimerase/dehydratase family protein [Gluconacetobacter takamatsuzukensis]MBB2204649.1 NAD-dependent epimerase/dehydratase family protein [Gluconacetobacter takamatsuzukensis]